MSSTTNDTTDKLFYSMMGTRLILYFIFMILNGAQSIYEVRIMARRKRINVKFFMYLAFTMFCFCRCISQSIWYFRPREYLVGTIYYVFFSFGNFFIFQQYIFIGGYWMELLYSFFVTKEIKKNGIKKVRWMSYSLALIFLFWQTPITIVYLYIDLGLLEGIGFVVLLILYFGVIWTNGTVLYRQLRLHAKKTNHDHYNDMIFKTKTLLIIIVIAVVLTLIYNVVFIIVEPTYNLFPIRLLCTGLIDIPQMIAIMTLMAEGKFYKYFLFIHITKTLKGINSKGQTTGHSLNNEDSTKMNSRQDSKMFSHTTDMDGASYRNEQASYISHVSIDDSDSVSVNQSVEVGVGGGGGGGTLEMSTISIHTSQENMV